jgi:UDP-GlcNAc:undecaprenyl-phosphate GlcNAc-1-phosphate transferase
VKVYDEAEVRTARAKPLVAFLVDLSYKRRVFEVLLDVVLIALSYYLAYAAVFGHLTGDEPLRRFLLAVPVLVSVKLLTFLGMGVYRGLWRYVSIDNLIVFAKSGGGRFGRQRPGPPVRLPLRWLLAGHLHPGRADPPGLADPAAV